MNILITRIISIIAIFFGLMFALGINNVEELITALKNFKMIIPVLGLVGLIFTETKSIKKETNQFDQSLSLKFYEYFKKRNMILTKLHDGIEFEEHELFLGEQADFSRNDFCFNEKTIEKQKTKTFKKYNILRDYLSDKFKYREFDNHINSPTVLYGGYYIIETTRLDNEILDKLLCDYQEEYEKFLKIIKSKGYNLIKEPQN